MVVMGIYKKRVFFDAYTGYSSFLLKPMYSSSDTIDINQILLISGYFPLDIKNIPLYISGELKNNNGKVSISALEIRETAISNETSLMFLMQLGLKLPEFELRRFIEITGPDIFSVVKSSKAEQAICSKDTDIDDVHVMEIIDKLNKIMGEFYLFQYVMKYGGNYDITSKIYKEYGENSIKELMNNPYKVAEAVKVPFQMIDNVAVSRGYKEFSEERIKAIALWEVRNELNSGNTYITVDSIIKSIEKKFGNIPKTAIVACIKSHPCICNDEENPDCIYLKEMLEDEKKAAKEIARIMKTAFRIPFHPELIDELQNETGFHLGNQQREAFNLARSTGIKILSGDPGTGKTTTLNMILMYIERVWEVIGKGKPTFALCAPAGRAAQRMKETTMRDAKTVHKLLEYQPYKGGEYYKDENDPIDADVVIVDEVSMLGLSTFTKLVSAIKNGTMLFLIGDPNQLQSVEPGDVLNDLIKLGVERRHLSEVFRQAEESLINQNAKKVIKGFSDLKTGKDFEIIKSSPEETPRILNNIIIENINEAQDKNRVQILSPSKKGSCGCKKGNESVQNIFNPGTGGIKYNFRNFKIADRVMLMSNNYYLGYYNGDVGYITAINDTVATIQIGDETIAVPKEQFCDMDLSYFCTIHKSQGSEYDYLIIVLQKDTIFMLDQNLLYTAITRGKKKVTIIYEGDTLNRAIATSRSGTRRSLLEKRTREELVKFAA